MMSYTIHVIRQAHVHHRKEPAMIRITIANQSVICNDHTVYALAIYQPQ